MSKRKPPTRNATGLLNNNSSDDEDETIPLLQTPPPGYVIQQAHHWQQQLPTPPQLQSHQHQHQQQQITTTLYEQASLWWLRTIATILGFILLFNILSMGLLVAEVSSSMEEVTNGAVGISAAINATLAEVSHVNLTKVGQAFEDVDDMIQVVRELTPKLHDMNKSPLLHDIATLLPAIHQALKAIEDAVPSLTNTAQQLSQSNVITKVRATIDRLEHDHVVEKAEVILSQVSNLLREADQLNVMDLFVNMTRVASKAAQRFGSLNDLSIHLGPNGAK